MKEKIIKQERLADLKIIWNEPLVDITIHLRYERIPIEKSTLPELIKVLQEIEREGNEISK